MWSQGVMFAMEMTTWGGGRPCRGAGRDGPPSSAARAGEPRVVGGVERRGAAPRAVGRRRGVRGARAHRGRPLPARRHVLLLRRALPAAWRREAGDVRARAALLPAGHRRALPEPRARRGAVRGHDPPRLLLALRGSGRRARAHDGRLRRARQREGALGLLRGRRARAARHPHAGHRRPRAGPRRCGCAASPAATTTRCRAQRRTSTLPPGRDVDPTRGGGDGLQPGRLLRAARRHLREALRALRRVGRPLRLPRGVGGAPHAHRVERLAGLGAGLPAPLGAGCRGHGRGHAGAGGLPDSTAWCSSSIGHCW